MINNSLYSCKRLAIDSSTWIGIQNSILSNKIRPSDKPIFSYKITNIVGTDKLKQTLEQAILDGHICVSSGVYTECTKLLEKDNFLHKMFDIHKDKIIQYFDKNTVDYLSKLQALVKFSSTKKISEYDLELCMLAREKDYVIITEEKHTNTIEEFKKIPNFCETNNIEWGNINHFMTFLLHLSHQ